VPPLHATAACFAACFGCVCVSLTNIHLPLNCLHWDFSALGVLDWASGPATVDIAVASPAHPQTCLRSSDSVTDHGQSVRRGQRTQFLGPLPQYRRASITSQLACIGQPA